MAVDTRVMLAERGCEAVWHTQGEKQVTGEMPIPEETREGMVMAARLRERRPNLMGQSR